MQLLEEYVRIQLPRLAAADEQEMKQREKNRSNSDYDFHRIVSCSAMLGSKMVLITLGEIGLACWLIADPQEWVITTVLLVYIGCILWMLPTIFSLKNSLHLSGGWNIVSLFIPVSNLFAVNRLLGSADEILTGAGYNTGFPLTDTEQFQAWNIFSKLECYENIKQKYYQ